MKTKEEQDLEREIDRKINYANPDAWIYIRKLIRLKIKQKLKEVGK